jgi:hypothetical protein
MTLHQQASSVIGLDTPPARPAASSLVPVYVLAIRQFFEWQKVPLTRRLTAAVPFRNQGVLPQAVGALPAATTELLCGSAWPLPDGALRSGTGQARRGGDCLHESSGPPVAGPAGARSHDRGAACESSAARPSSDPCGSPGAEPVRWAPHLLGGVLRDLLRRVARPRDGGRPAEGERGPVSRSPLSFWGDPVGWERGPRPRSHAPRKVAVVSPGLFLDRPLGAAVWESATEELRHVPSEAVGTSRRDLSHPVRGPRGPRPAAEEATTTEKRLRARRGREAPVSARGGLFRRAVSGAWRLSERATNERATGRTNPG